MLVRVVLASARVCGNPGRIPLSPWSVWTVGRFVDSRPPGHPAHATRKSGGSTMGLARCIFTGTARRSVGGSERGHALPRKRPCAEDTRRCGLFELRAHAVRNV